MLDSVFLSKSNPQHSQFKELSADRCYRLLLFAHQKVELNAMTGSFWFESSKPGMNLRNEQMKCHCNFIFSINFLVRSKLEWIYFYRCVLLFGMKWGITQRLIVIFEIYDNVVSYMLQKLFFHHCNLFAPQQG